MNTNKSQVQSLEILPNELGIVFRGIHSRNFGLKLQTVADQPFGTMSEQIQDIPAIIGDMYQGMNIQSKTINIGFRTVGITSNQDKENRIHMIADWLKPINDGEDELRIDILPRWMFYAHVNSAFDITPSGLYNFSFVIPFSCSDPHMYGEQKQYAINGFNLAMGTGNEVTGTADTFKLYDLFKSAISYTPSFLEFDYTSTVNGKFRINSVSEQGNGVESKNNLINVDGQTDIQAESPGHFSGKINWTLPDDTRNIYLEFQEVTDCGTVTISNLKLYESDELADSDAVNMHTGKVDDSLISVNENTTVTIHDSLSNETSYPIFTLIAPTELSKIAITQANKDDYFYMGSEIDEDSPHQIVDNMPRRLFDQCNTLRYWKTFNDSFVPTFTVENGIIGKGSALDSTADALRLKIGSDGAYMFGSPLVKGTWNGAGAMHVGLPGAYKNYRLSVRFELINHDPRAKGKIEVYGLDQNNRRMHKLMLKDNSNSKKNIAQIQIGDHDKYHELYYGDGGTTKKGKTTYKKIKYYANGKKKTTTKTIKVNGKKKKVTTTNWVTKNSKVSTAESKMTNFYGELEVTHINGKYTGKITKMDYKQNTIGKPITINWTDTSGTYAGHSLNGLAFYIAKYPIKEDLVVPRVGYLNDLMRLYEIRVYEILNDGKNELTDPSPIVRTGDEIKFDTATGIVYKNGAPFNSVNGHLLKAPGSNLQGLAVEESVDSTYSFYPDINHANWLVDHRSVRI